MANASDDLLGRDCSRRGFLGRVAGAAGVLAAPWALGGAAAGGGWKLRLSTSSNHFRTLPIEEALRRVAAAGYGAVDIWSAYQGCPHLDDALARLGSAGLDELLKRHGLSLAAFSVYVGGYAKYAELLGKLGGGVAIRGSAGPCEPKQLTGRMKEFLEGLKPELELAEKHNSYLAIENHGSALLDSLDSLKALVESGAHPRLGIALAPYHLQAGGASVEEAIRIAGKRLLFFYAWQHQPEVKELPGHGTTDFTPWLATLAQIGYPRYVNAFSHHPLSPDAMTAALIRSREYLAECNKKARGS